MNYNSILDSIANLISKNNTTTSSYNISLSMTSKVLTIKSSSIKNPIPNVILPAIIIDIENNKSEFQSLGSGAIKKHIFNVSIYGIVDYGMGQPQGRDLSDAEMMILAGNVEKLFNYYIGISGTVDYSNITNVDYDVEMGNDTWNSGFKINLECTKWS
jgi:hypothetical protein